MELLLSLTPKQLGRKLNLYEANKLAATHLPAALMAFYVDIEFTGSTHTLNCIALLPTELTSLA